MGMSTAFKNIIGKNGAIFPKSYIYEMFITVESILISKQFS